MEYTPISALEELRPKIGGHELDRTANPSNAGLQLLFLVLICLAIYWVIESELNRRRQIYH